MHLKKTLKVKTTIDNAISFFVDEYKNLMHILQNVFIGHCYNGYLLHDVITIKNIEEMEYRYDDITKCNILAEVEFDCSRIIAREMIFVKIEQDISESKIARGSFMIDGTYLGGYATVKYDEDIMVKVGSVVPCIVQVAQHNVGMSYIFVACTPFAPSKNIYNYKIEEFGIHKEVELEEPQEKAIVAKYESKFLKGKKLAKLGDGKFAVHSISGPMEFKDGIGEELQLVSKETAEMECKIARINFAKLCQWYDNADKKEIQYLMYSYV